MGVLRRETGAGSGKLAPGVRTGDDKVNIERDDEADIKQDIKFDIEQDNKVGTRRDNDRVGNLGRDNKRAAELAAERQDDDGVSILGQDNKRAAELAAGVRTRV